MNAGFQRVDADLAISVTEFKKNPNAVFKAAEAQQVAVLSHNQVVGYVVSPTAWERIMELIEDIEDMAEIERRKGETGVPVKLDEL